MTNFTFDGFAIALPGGWASVLEDATYSDPDQLPPCTFSGPSAVGALYVSTPLFDPEDQPGSRPADAEALARGWGVGRGRAIPLTCTSGEGPRGAFASATYKLGDDFVQVWFFSSGRAVLQASYVCAWDQRGIEREAVETIVASLRLT